MHVYVHTHTHTRTQGLYLTLWFWQLSLSPIHFPFPQSMLDIKIKACMWQEVKTIREENGWFNCTRDGYDYGIAKSYFQQQEQESGVIQCSLPPTPSLKCLAIKGHATVVTSSQMETLMKGVMSVLLPSTFPLLLLNLISLFFLISPALSKASEPARGWHQQSEGWFLKYN